MEVVKAGSLQTFVEYRKIKKKPISDNECSIIIKQVLEAILHIHSLDVIHRDLKPQNILLKSFTQLTDSVKIADLGLGKKMFFEKAGGETEVCGTAIYMAPEIVFKQNYGKVFFADV